MSATTATTKPDSVGTILEIKEVARDAEGGRLEWRLEVTDESGITQWLPYSVSADGKNKRPPWIPLPGSQFVFFTCPIFEALYHGTRGPGKTISLIMDFVKDVGKGHGKSWRGILFRREYKDLDDVVKKIQEEIIDSGLFPDAQFNKSKSDYKIVFSTGEELLLRHLKDEKDYDNYHGHEYPWIGFEELTQWENDKAYTKMFSCCRASKPGIFCRVRATTNPYGVGHNWVKKRFQLPDMSGKIIRVPGEMPRVAIKGHLSENFLLLHATPNYPIITAQAANSEAEKRAWLYGDWDVTSGGMVDDIWDYTIHVLPDFPISHIPHGWTLTRAYDHGQSKPFAVGWFLESNGEGMEVTVGYNEDGFVTRTVGNIRGDVIMWMEWYGCQEGSDNVGLRMAARDIARGILDREEDEGAEKLVTPGPADTEIWTKDNRGHRISPADDMEDEGVIWDRADKSAGSRKLGWERMREMLRGAIPEKDGTREFPGFYVCSRCVHTLELVPPMPRDQDGDPDDVPKKYEDHLADMIRYRLTYENPIAWRRGF
jgi:hypothetical protein